MKLPPRNIAVNERFFLGPYRLRVQQFHVASGYIFPQQEPTILEIKHKVKSSLRSYIVRLQHNRWESSGKNEILQYRHIADRRECIYTSKSEFRFAFFISPLFPVHTKHVFILKFHFSVSTARWASKGSCGSIRVARLAERKLWHMLMFGKYKYTSSVLNLKSF